MALSDSDAEAATYGEEYLRWKGWDASKFGIPSDSDRDRFAQEIAALPGLDVRRALDVGFGNGAFLGFGRERGWQMSGTEINPVLVKIAREAGFDAHPATALPILPAGSFDLVTAFDVLEHIPQDRLVSFVTELGMLLLPNGILLCRFPNGDSPFGRPYQNGDITHRTVIGEAKMIYLARRAGLRIVRLAGEARPRTDRSWRTRLAKAVIHGLELTLEPCIKRALFPGWKFALFSPNTVVALRPERRS